MKKYDLAFLVLLVAASVLLFYHVGKPFWGQFDWTGAWFGTIARNFLTLPIAETKLAAITVSGTLNPRDWTFYNHYTSTYPLLTALSMIFFGVTESAIRIVPIIFSILMIFTIYLLTRKFLHPVVGIFGIFAIIFTPMFIYYGKLPVHEQAVLFFSLTALYSYLKNDFAKMFIFLGLGFLTSWTGAYMLFLLTMHLFLTKKWQVFKLFPAYLIMALITILHFAHIYVSSDIIEFATTLSERTSGGNLGSNVIFTPVTFVIKQLKWFFVLYTRPLALLSLATLAIFFIKSVLKRKIALETQILLLLFAWGFGQWLAVPRISWIHDYMLIYFLPFVTLASGMVFHRLFLWQKTLGFFLIFGFVLLSIFFSLPFTNALLKSQDQTSKLYTLAKVISEKTKYGDRILVVAENEAFEKRYPSHYLSYYSNRYIKYDFRRNNPNTGNYNLVIVPINDEFTIYEPN